ncbi:unnamed protein product [Bursaphelenchus xylophilus]|uniref:(pine wood nematode) hypothetical protein n=1 Tax=Bursaphelenchus xylophilus TaxID=6326 RepID=A0A1I7RN73_BURXY|nr:unnamed protein product [Bursaphelenchus xylophilus]CAG9123716.1 unnamed protein product [Bursaphelenchus xylophilus]
MNVLLQKTATPDTLNTNIVRINRIQPDDNVVETTLTPMVAVATGIKNSHVAIGMTKSGQLACIHPHLLVAPQLEKLLTSNASHVDTEINHVQIDQFHAIVTPGRTFEGRLGLIPNCLKDVFQSAGLNIKYLAVSVENLSVTYTGIAKFVKSHRASILLKSLDRSAYEVIFPLVLVPQERRADYLNIPKDKILFYYTACKNLPGSKYPLRAYTLSVVEGGQHIIEQLAQREANEEQAQQSPAEEDSSESPPSSAANEIDLIQF